MRTLDQLKGLFRQKIKVLTGGPANQTRGLGLLAVLDALAEEVKGASATYQTGTFTAQVGGVQVITQTNLPGFANASAIAAIGVRGLDAQGVPSLDPLPSSTYTLSGGALTIDAAADIDPGDVLEISWLTPGSITASSITTAQLRNVLVAGTGISITETAGKLVISSTVSVGAAQKAPAAPTAGVVDDIGDTFSFLPTPSYPAFSQYKVAGLPGVTGAVALDGTNSYVQGARIFVKVVGAVPINGLGVYVAGSGTIPDGGVLTNAQAFTGAVVIPPPAGDTVAPTITFTVPAAGAALAPGAQVLLTAQATDNVAVQSVTFTNGATGAVLGQGAKNGNTYTLSYVVPSTAGPLSLVATATDAAGNSQSATVNVTVQATANTLPTADAGSDATIQLPTNQVALLGSGADAEGPVTYAWAQITGPSNATGMPASTQNVVVSNLLAGTYMFRLMVADSAGATKTDDVLVTVQPAAVTAKAPRFTIDSDSIGTEDYAPGWHADFEAELTRQLAAKTTAQLAAVGLTTAAPIFNWVGISGQTAAQMDAAASDVDGSFDTDKANFLLTIGEPYNSYRGAPNANVTAKQGADSYINYCVNRKAANSWRGIVALLGFQDHLQQSSWAYAGNPTYYQPRADFVQVTADYIAYLQGRIGAGTAGVDVLALVDEVFDQTNSAMSPDGVHATRAGYTTGFLIRRLVAGVMQLLFGTPQPAAVPRPAQNSGNLFTGAQYVSFPTNINQVPAGRQVTVRSGVGGNYGVATGLSDLMLAAGQDGRIILPVLQLRNGIVGVGETYERANYNTYKAGLWLSSNNGGLLGVVNMGSAGETAVALSSYKAFSLNRVSATWTVEGWDGTTWAKVADLSYTGTGNAYIYSDIYSTGGLDSVQGIGLTPAVVASGPNYAQNFIALTATGAGLSTSNAVTTNTTGAAYGTYNAPGTTGRKIQGGTTGAFGYRTVSPSDYDVVVGLRISGAQGAGYPSFRAGVWNSTPDPNSQNRVVASLSNGTSDIVQGNHAVAIGEFAACWVEYNAGNNTTTFSAKFSTDGVNWQLLRSLGTVNGQITVECEIDASGPGQVSCLQGFNTVQI